MPVLKTKMQGMRRFISGRYNGTAKRKATCSAVFSRQTPLSVAYGMGIAEHDQEGRIITLEFDDYQLINVYNAEFQRGLTRLEYRMQWEDAFRDHISRLASKKPVIICGDLNVAHQEIEAVPGR